MYVCTDCKSVISYIDAFLNLFKNVIKLAKYAPAIFTPLVARLAVLHLERRQTAKELLLSHRHRRGGLAEHL